jgi:hypothetical protein
MAYLRVMRLDDCSPRLRPCGHQCRGPVSPSHRPSVTFGAHRTSAPARRPSVAWCVSPGGRLQLVLRFARAGAGHRWKSIGWPSPGGRPAAARHPSFMAPASVVTVAPAIARSHVLSGARDSRAPRCTRRGRNGSACHSGPTGAVPVVSPVAFRSPACRFFFSDDWLRHARFGEPGSPAAPLNSFSGSRVREPGTGTRFS